MIPMKLTMKNSWQMLLTMVFAVVMFSCGGKDKVGTDSLISGANGKTWKINKELNAAGDKEKLSKSEKQETMQFYTDGRFALGAGGTLQTGTWSFDQAAKKLTLQFEGQDVTENFDVAKLTDDKMELRAADGSVMELEAD
jgi:hypothetical protein